MLYTGPTIQCGLAMTWKRYNQDYEGEKRKPTVFDGYDIDNDPDQVLKRLNITWGLGAGFQYKQYFLRGGYDFGIITPYKNTDFSTGVHTRGRLDQWNIKIGVYLWYKD